MPTLISGSTSTTSTGLSQTSGNRGASFAQGDFNYDGTVNLLDFNFLAANFNHVVASAFTRPVGDVASRAIELVNESLGTSATT